MAESARPSPEEIILYDKHPNTKIATITFNRPEFLNASTTAARLRYADLLHGANVDDDVRVVVIRGVGDDFGSGADLPEVMEGADSLGFRLAELKLSQDDLMLGDAIESGLADSVRDNDAKFPPDFRLSKSGRAKKG